MANPNIIHVAPEDTNSFSYRRKHRRSANSVAPGVIVLIGAGFVLGKHLYNGAPFPSTFLEVASLFYGGVIVSSVFSAISLKYLRKVIHYYLASITLIITGALYTANGSMSVDTVYAGSFFGGFSFGLSLMTVLVHGGEVSVKYLRGNVISNIQFSLDCGIFIAMFVIGLSTNNYFDPLKYCGIIEIIEGVLAFITTFFCVYESPIFLLEANNETEAVKNITELRRETSSLTPIVQYELNDIKMMLRNTSNIRIVNFLALLKILACRLLFTLATSFPLNAYLRQIYMGYISTVSSQYLFILGRFTADLVPLILIDRFGRKPLFLFSAIGSGILLLAIQACFSIGADTIIPDFKLIETAGLLTIFFQLFLGLGISSVSYTYMSEVFDYSNKSFVNAFIIIVESILHIILINIDPTYDFIKGLTYFTAVVLTMAGALSFALLPETKGKTLLESKASIEPLITLRN